MHKENGVWVGGPSTQEGQKQWHRVRGTMLKESRDKVGDPVPSKAETEAGGPVPKKGGNRHRVP